MQFFYTDHFVLPLPPKHRFPMQKYTMLRELAEQSGLAPMVVPPAASNAELQLAHEASYIDAVQTGQLDDKAMRRIGFPWSEAMVERSRRSCGATIAACRHALATGCAVNLAGGTHHAFADHGQGYCVFNDSAVAARQMQHEGLVERVVVIDCDVHQGNGTAHILRDDASVTTFSIHGEKNFPFRKESSDIDIALPDGTADSIYLAALEDGLQRALTMAQTDLVIYLSGADPHENDRLGRLALSFEGLARRDALVFAACRERHLPVAVTMGGGYGKDVSETVKVHWQTVRAAVDYARNL